MIELSTTVATLSIAEINLLKECHQAMFKSVIQLSSPYLKCFIGEEMSANVLIVPIKVWQMQNPPLAYIDFEMAERVVRTGDPNTRYNPLQWPFPV